MALVLYSVSAHDDISVLWNKFAAGMSESKRGIIRNIDEYVRDEYGAVSVGALFRLQSNTIEEDIIRLGGKAGWVRSLEAIAGLEFKSCAPVPASALLALRPPLAEVTPSTSNTAHVPGDHKPDSFRRGLTRNNTCMSVICCGRGFFRIVWVCSRRGTKQS